MKSIYNGKFSIPHYDSMSDDDWYLRAFENSSEQYKKEVYDIYFGATFSSILKYDVAFGIQWE